MLDVVEEVMEADEASSSKFVSEATFPPNEFAFSTSPYGINSRRWMYNEGADKLKSYVTEHVQRSLKGSVPIFLGTLIAGGGRDADHVNSVTGFAVDLDDTSEEEINKICCALNRDGIKFYAATTFSHLLDVVPIEQSLLLKKAQRHGLGDLDTREAMDEAVRLCCKNALRVARDDNGAPRFNELIHDTTYTFYEVEPKCKWRIWFAFDQGYSPEAVAAVFNVTEDVARGPMWQAGLRKFCRLYGIPYDTSCEPICHSYFRSSCPPETAHLARVIEGTGQYCVSLLAWLPMMQHEFDALDEIARPRAKAETKTKRPKMKSYEQAAGQTDDGDAVAIPLRWLKKYGLSFAIATALADNVKRGSRGSGKPGAVAECPFEDEHSAAGGSGFYVVDGADNLPFGFGAQCSHTTCKMLRGYGDGTDRKVMLEKMLAKGWITRAQLEDPALGGGPLRPTKDDVRLDVEQLASACSSDDCSVLLDELVPFDILFIKEMCDLIAEKCAGVTRTDLFKEVQKRRKAREKKRTCIGSFAVSRAAHIACKLLHGEVTIDEAEADRTRDGVSDEVWEQAQRAAPLIRDSMAVVKRVGFDNFRQNEIGEISRGSDDDGEQLCSPLVVIARGRDAAGKGQALHIAVRDQDGVWHDVHLPLSKLHAKNTEWLSELQSLGFILFGQADMFVRLLLAAPVIRRFRIASRNGWQNDRYDAYMFGQQALHASDYDGDALEYPDGEHLPEKGALDDWTGSVGRLAGGNVELINAINLNLSAVLLEPLGIEGGGIHSAKGTSRGKSTSLYAGASVFGGKPFVGSWDASPTYVYAKAKQRSGMSMPLDEVDLATNKDHLAKTVYAIANGQQPGRGKVDGSVRERGATWCVTIPSNGEKSPGDRLIELGAKATGGIEVRLPNVPWSGFTCYHEHGSDGAAFAHALQHASHNYHGTAGRAFVRGLLDDPTAFERADLLVKKVASKLAPIGSDGAEVRVARRFASVAAAGELAVEFGIVPWRPGAAVGAAMLGYRRWLMERGGHGNTEVIKGRAALLRNLITYGSANFQTVKTMQTGRTIDLEDGETVREEITDVGYTEDFVHNRRGFKKHVGAGTEYWLTDADFAWMCDRHDPDGVRQALAQDGLVIRDGKSLKAKRQLPGFGRTRVTVVFLRDDSAR